VGCTHLAINLCRNAKANEVKDYGDKKGSTRKRVDLPNSQVSTNLNAGITTRAFWRVGTDPYRPAVGTTPKDDVQLKIKSCDIFPTGRADR
jgi:hypothetical protein